jgi:hypothetical protein
VHLAHPLGVKAFSYRRVKNDERDAADLADLLRMGRLPEAWIAPPATRELRQLVRHRAKLVALRSSVKCQVHAVLAACGVQVPMSDLFGAAGQQLLARVQQKDQHSQEGILTGSTPSGMTSPRWCCGIVHGTSGAVCTRRPHGDDVQHRGYEAVQGAGRSTHLVLQP